MSQPHWKLSDDTTKLVVDFPTMPPVRLELDAAEVDNFIHMLASLRQEMTPPVPIDQEPDPGTRVEAAPGRWWVEPRGAEGAAIAILHPGHRWVGLALSPAVMKEMIQTLVRCLPIP